MTDRQSRTDENRGSHVTHCLFCKDSKNGDTEGRGEIYMALEKEGKQWRWEMSWSWGKGMRGGVRWRGNGLTVSKRRWDMLQRRGHFHIFISFCFGFIF